MRIIHTNGKLKSPKPIINLLALMQITLYQRFVNPETRFCQFMQITLYQHFVNHEARFYQFIGSVLTTQMF